MISDTWLVYRYDRRYNYYDYFIEFTTAEQLVHIILEELRFYLCGAITEELQLPDFEDNTLADLIAPFQRSNNLHAELAALLQLVISSDLGQRSEFFCTLERLFRVTGTSE